MTSQCCNAPMQKTISDNLKASYECQNCKQALDKLGKPINPKIEVKHVIEPINQINMELMNPTEKFLAIKIDQIIDFINNNFKK